MRQPDRLHQRIRTPVGLLRAVPVGLALAALAGCSSLESNRWTNIFLPYRVEVVQGNVVTSEQLRRAVPGMSRVQVRDVLGSPLLTDIFHADRWDYVFTLNRPGTPLQNRAVMVFFEGDKLTRIEAPALPTDSEFIDSIDPYRFRGSVPALALTAEQVRALPPPPPPSATASAPGGPQRTYPPLEPRG